MTRIRNVLQLAHGTRLGTRERNLCINHSTKSSNVVDSSKCLCGPWGFHEEHGITWFVPHSICYWFLYKRWNWERARSALKKAALEANAATLQKLHDLEIKELRIKQKKQKSNWRLIPQRLRPRDQCSRRQKVTYHRVCIYANERRPTRQCHWRDSNQYLRQAALIAKEKSPVI